MSSSITATLFVWLKKRRIIHSVAQEMGIPYVTLLYELRGRARQPKLGADELVPLFRAIRAIGYEDELNRQIRHWVRELQVDQPNLSGDHLPDLLQLLVSNVEELSEATARLNSTESAKELMDVRNKLRTELVPAFYKLQDIVETRLEKINKKPREEGGLSDETSPQPQQP